MLEDSTSPIPPEPIAPVGAGIIPPAVPSHIKFPYLLTSLLIMLTILATFSIYLFLQVRTLTLNKIAPSPSPTPSAKALAKEDPTADWKTYMGLKYTFKYPNNWIQDNSSNTIALHSPDQKIAVVLDVAIKEIPITYWTSGAGECEKVSKEENITLHGISAKRVLLLGVINEMCGDSHQLRHEIVTIPNINKLVDVLDLRYEVDSLSTIDQILSTFKFTD